MSNSLKMDIKYSSLLKFALPTILSNVFLNIYGVVDGIFVSNFVGTSALSAVNIVWPMLMVVMSIGIMLGTGGSALVSMQLGAGKKVEAGQNFTMLFILCGIIGGGLSFLGYIFRKPLLYNLGADESLYILCEQYAVPLLITLTFVMLGAFFQMFFIAEGRPGLGMAFSVIGGGLNMLLDYIFMGPMEMGIMGASVATGLSYSFPAATGIIWFALNKKGSLFFVKPKLRWRVFFKAVTNGSSEMVAILSSSSVNILMNILLMRLVGEDGVAAISIILYVYMLMTSVFFGYASGIAPLTSFNFGADNTDNLKLIHRMSLRIILAASIAIFCAAIIFAKPLVEIFVSSQTEIYKMALRGFFIFSPGFLFTGFNIYASSLFTALNNGKVSALLSFMRTLVFLVPSLLGFPLLLGIDGIWIATPLAELLSIILTVYFIRKKKTVYKYA
ncbi:MAG: MATE family efflux transporter [Firmicutes bacterium]|nr:MATE family efflux transporter [Bacillota bacterium]